VFFPQTLDLKNTHSCLSRAIVTFNTASNYSGIRDFFKNSIFIIFDIINIGANVKDFFPQQKASRFEVGNKENEKKEGAGFCAVEEAKRFL